MKNQQQLKLQDNILEFMAIVASMAWLAIIVLSILFCMHQVGGSDIYATCFYSFIAIMIIFKADFFLFYNLITSIKLEVKKRK